VTSDTQELTIEQLAAATGMTVRNIRNHQSRGLLPPPEVRARTGYYGPQHVERLRLIQEMQAEGFNLSAIKRLIGDAGAAEHFVGFRRAIQAPFETEPPEIVTAEELAARFGIDGELDLKLLEKARRLELIVPLGDGRFEAPSPALLDAAEEVIRRGIPLQSALNAIEKVKRACESASRAFVNLFLYELWKPFDEAGQPDERWDEVTETIERLRPIASEAMLAVFRQTMTAEVEDAFGKVLERQARKKR
jgi:DNA-binding transcriptional MerR regulator